MARTLRKECDSCGKLNLYTEGLRRTRCLYCGADVVLPDTRNAVFVQQICPACDAAFQVETGVEVARCPSCGRNYGLRAPGGAGQYVLREEVSVDQAIRTAHAAGVGRPESVLLYFLPNWMYQGTEIGWVFGNEKERAGGDRRGGGRAGGGVVAPTGGRVEYVKREVVRPVREYVVDPIADSFGWKPYPLHSESRTLQALDPAAIKLAGGRVVEPAFEPDEAMAEGRRKAGTKALFDERELYRLWDHRTLCHEGLSLVYHPFWVVYFEPPDVPGSEGRPFEWMAIDAIGGEVTRRPEAGGPDFHRRLLERAPLGVDVLMEISCDSCGKRFDHLEPASVLICESCMTAWALADGDKHLVEARFAVPVRPEPAGEPLVYLPVWRYRVQVKTERRMLANRAQWKRFNKLVEMQPDPADQKRPIHFYYLAHGSSRRGKVDTLSLSLTRMQPELSFGPPTQRRARHATHPVEDAREMAFSIYLHLFKDLTQQNIHGLKETHVDSGTGELVFVPCVSRRREISDLVLGVTLQMAQAA